MLRTKYFKVKTEERLPIQKNKEYNPGTIHVDPSGRIKDGGKRENLTNATCCPPWLVTVII